MRSASTDPIGATIAAGTSWSTNTAPASPAPPCWKAYTATATHTAYSCVLNRRKATKARRRDRFRSAVRSTPSAATARSLTFRTPPSSVRPSLRRRRGRSNPSDAARTRTGAGGRERGPEGPRLLGSAVRWDSEVHVTAGHAAGRHGRRLLGLLGDEGL